MNPSRDYLAGLAQLHDLGDADERRRAWRQGLASLSAAALNQRAAPLEAVSPDGLLASIRTAFRTGLVDDVHWMSPSFAAAAFFEIAAALPASEEKRELGRRVLEALLTGDAATFALLATSLASTSRRGLSTPPVRARVAVAVRLPIGLETDVDRLALALLCRPDLEREWLSGPSVGALPARRMSARLMERAAREAARRALDGDDFGTRIFRRPRVRAAVARLLSDRESLVWRHAASARGLLAVADETLAEEIERGLSDDLGPTEWRRAATSLAASLAHKPTSVVGRCQDLLAGEMMRRDPGVAAVMIFGLSRAATLEPEAVDALLPLLIEAGDIESIEAYVDLLGEHPGWKFGGRAKTVALERLRGGALGDDDGLVALGRVLDGELSPLGGGGRRPSLRQHVFSALMAFVEGRDLRPFVEAALATAGLGLGLLERIDESVPAERQRAFSILRDLDRGLLESSLLADLMLMVGLDPTARGPSDLGGMIGRMRTHLLRSAPLVENNQAQGTQQSFMHRRRLRALVHAIDGEGFPQWDDTVASTRERRLRTTTLLLERLGADTLGGESDPQSSVRRPILAALARAVEGIVRDELAEIGELALFIGARLHRADDFVVLSEATLSTELKEVFGALAELSRRWDEPGIAPGAVIAGFAAFAEVLPPGLTAPVEAVRRALVNTARTLGRIGDARSLVGLTAGPAAGSLIALGENVQDLTALVTGVWRRLGQPERRRGLGRDPFVALEAVVAQAGRGGGGPPGDLGGAIADAVAGTRADLPHGVAEVIARATGRLSSLPAEASDKDAVASEENERALPSWLPPSRVLGGFYVQRPVGRGTAGSVFVVCRAEDRHDAGAERFALKVPSYGGSVAHTLSEAEFLRMFREEAGALLTLPTHRNLAGFVTFDARARPRPILVMELVDGLTLDRALARGDLSFPRLLAVLDGIAAGLQAMHALGVGHLDVKPANVILRTPRRTRSSTTIDEVPPTPVLVDFGLAGRKIRPGCASPFYGAPEVWMNDGADPGASPAAADVYSFCCLAYELITGARLFTGETLPAVIAAHFGHQGDPAGLAPLRADPRFEPLAAWLARGLVPSPTARASMSELRADLPALGAQIRTSPRELGLATASLSN